MRTTVTLDDDVAFALQRESQASGRSFKATLNTILRRGLARPAGDPLRPKFEVHAQPGHLRPGLSTDNVAELIEIAEGPLAR